MNTSLQALGQYTPLQTLAETRDCCIYLAEAPDSGSRVIIKTPSDQVRSLKKEVGLKSKFKREMDLLSAFDHPNIVRMADSHYDEKECRIVFPYEKGQVLTNLLKTRLRLPLQEAAHLLGQLLSALEYAHRRGVVHCDINPNNIFITEDSRLLLFDFGLAVTEAEAAAYPEGKVVGTLPFVAPEQLGMTGFKIDTRSDLFCAGLIFYAMTAGAAPVSYDPGGALQDFIDRFLKTEFPPVAGLPFAVNQVLLTALRPSLEERYQTAEGFRYDIVRAVLVSETGEEAGFVLRRKDAVLAADRKRSFIGRERELSRLREGLRRLKQGAGYYQLFYGPSGIGKTEIIREFRSAHAADHRFFISSKCNIYTFNRPFSAVRDLILKTVSATVNGPSEMRAEIRELLETELGAQSGVLCRTVPEAAALFQAIGEVDKVEDEKESDRITQVLINFFLTLSGRIPIILFLDDLQWVDTVSFNVLKGLMGAGARLFFISNYRTSRDNGDSIQDTPAESAGFHDTCSVAPFSDADIRSMIETRFGRLENGGELAEMLMSCSDRSPFSVVEAIRFLLENGGLTLEEPGWSYAPGITPGLPPSFDPVSLVLRKAEALPDSYRRFLRYASLIQGPFFPHAPGQLAGFDAKSAAAFADSLEQQGFLSKRLDGRYIFTHDRLQESIASDIPEHIAAMLHGSLGDHYYLDCGRDPESIFFAAEHFRMSGDPARSVKACAEAAAYAREKMSFDLAIHYYKLTVFLAYSLRKTSASLPVDLNEIRMALGDVYMLTGKNREALEVFGSLLDEGRAGSRDRELELKYKIGSTYHNMGDFDNAINYFSTVKSLSSRLF